MIALLVASALLIGGPAFAEEHRASTKLPTGVPPAVGCTVPTGSAGKAFLRLKRRGSVRYRFFAQGIPNTSLSREKAVTVVYYSPDGNRAIVDTLFILPTGGYTVSSSPYFLVRAGAEWSTTDGQGGPGTYERVAAFVRSLDGTPLSSVPLRRYEVPGCSSERDSREPADPATRRNAP